MTSAATVIRRAIQPSLDPTRRVSVKDCDGALAALDALLATRSTQPEEEPSVASRPADAATKRYPDAYDVCCKDREALSAQVARLHQELERQREEKRAALRALQEIFALLTHRHWWNDNVWAARQISKEVLIWGGVHDADA